MWPLEHNSVYDKQGMDFKQGYDCRMPYRMPKKKGDQRDLTWLPNQALCPFHNLFARLKMIPGYVRLLQETFFVRVQVHQPEKGDQVIKMRIKCQDTDVPDQPQ